MEYHKGIQEGREQEIRRLSNPSRSESRYTHIMISKSSQNKEAIVVDHCYISLTLHLERYICIVKQLQLDIFPNRSCPLCPLSSFIGLPIAIHVFISSCSRNTCPLMSRLLAPSSGTRTEEGTRTVNLVSDLYRSATSVLVLPTALEVWDRGF